MVSSEEEADVKAEVKTAEGVEWDVDMEIQLFYAMANHKPVGINKHFQMACIWEKLSNSITKEISTQDIWQRLGSMYDLQLLDETEAIPFPNAEVAFSLPDAEYGPLIKQKCKEIILADDSEDGRSPSPKTTPRSSSRGTVSKDSTPKASTRKESAAAPLAKARKESGSSHASTDTPSVKSEKEFDRRRDSRDSNASGPRDGPARKPPAPAAAPAPAKDRPRPRASVAEPAAEEEAAARRGRRRPAPAAASPAASPAVPAKRRRT